MNTTLTLMDLAGAIALVFMTGHPRAARQLLREKEIFRELEMRAADEHFGRARVAPGKSIEMSKLRLDIALDRRRVNAHWAAVA